MGRRCLLLWRGNTALALAGHINVDRFGGSVCWPQPLFDRGRCFPDPAWEPSLQAFFKNAWTPRAGDLLSRNWGYNDFSAIRLDSPKCVRFERRQVFKFYSTKGSVYAVSNSWCKSVSCFRRIVGNIGFAVLRIRRPSGHGFVLECAQRRQWHLGYCDHDVGNQFLRSARYRLE